MFGRDTCIFVLKKKPNPHQQRNSMTTSHPHKTDRQRSWDQEQEEALKRHHENSDRHSAFNVDKHTEKTMITSQQLIDTSAAHAHKGASDAYERIRKLLLEVVKNDFNPGSYEWARLQGLLEQALLARSTTKVQVFRSIKYRVDASPFGYPLPTECVPAEDDIKKQIHKDLLPVFAGWEWSSDPRDGCMIFTFDWSNQVKERLRELENDEPPEDEPQPKKQKQQDSSKEEKDEKNEKNEKDKNTNHYGPSYAGMSNPNNKHSGESDEEEGSWHIIMPDA